MKLVALHAPTDNPIRMQHGGRAAIVVEPDEAQRVAHGLELAGILVTPPYRPDTGTGTGTAAPAAIRPWKHPFR